MSRKEVRAAIAHVGAALRDPEEFALRWHQGAAGYGWLVWGALGATAIAGTITYGLTLGIRGGPAAPIWGAAGLTLAAGLAWAIPLPGLYIFNSLTGSRLAASTTLLAVLVTTSWGGLAMIASVPVSWFFATAVPHRGVFLVVNLAVFTAVGIAMTDVLGRVVHTLEPERGHLPLWCLTVVGAIGSELFYAFGIFNLAA
jgi:hypothetical protein